jgi:hypothetical protein
MSSMTGFMGLHFVLPGQITGGIGRFAHTGGADTTRGDFNVFTKVGTFPLAGEITYREAEGAGQ